MMFCTSTPKKYTSYELQIICLICVDCDIGSKEKTKIRNADSNSHNLDPESSIPLLQENKYKVKQWEVFILWSVYNCTYSVSKHKTVDGLAALERSHYYSRNID